MKEVILHRNQPIATLIKNFINKKSGKVSVARPEIKRRFLYLDWKDQKKIVLAFLDSTQSDRQWMYARLLDIWDKSFEKKVQQLWEEYHEERCAWLIIRHFPKEYVLSQLDFFKGERNYYFVCRRFCGEGNFKIDPLQFLDKPNDYLYLLTLQGVKLDEVEAERILFGMFKNLREPLKYRSISNRNGINRNDVPSALSFPEISLAIYNLEKLWCFNTIRKFEEWNAIVVQKLCASEEYKQLLHTVCSDDEYLSNIREILLGVIDDCLDAEHKELSFDMPNSEDDSVLDDTILNGFESNTLDHSEYEKILSDNPQLQALVKEFDLGYIGDEE